MSTEVYGYATTKVKCPHCETVLILFIKKSFFSKKGQEAECQHCDKKLVVKEA